MEAEKYQITDKYSNEPHSVLDVVYLVQHSYEWHPITDKVFRKKEDAEYYKSIQKDANKYWDVVKFNVY